MSEAASSVMAQSWPWGCQIAVKKKDKLPLVLPDLSINDVKIKRESSLKLSSVMIHENLTWTTHVKLLESKISKSVGILFI